MSKYVVTFTGVLLDQHAAQLHRAGLAVERGRNEIDVEAGKIGSGASVFDVVVEADSEAEASKKVADALGANAGQFSRWEIEPT